MSVVRRVGKKTNPKINDKIISYFPYHISYIEPFSGGLGMFRYKPRAKYNFLNDLDGNVINAFLVITEKRKELIEYLERVPYAHDVFQYFRKMTPKTDVQRAVKFLILSNWGYMGKPESVKFGLDGSKNELLRQIETTYLDLCKGENRFLNCDFADVFKQINFRKPTEAYPGRLNDKDTAFAYLDPPYLETDNNYDTPKWTEADVIRCYGLMKNEGIKMAMSEFDHPFILEKAKEYGFNIVEIGERQNMKNRRTEILIMNYDLPKLLF